MEHLEASGVGPGQGLLSPHVDGEGLGSVGQGWLSETNYGPTGAQSGLEATVYPTGFTGCRKHTITGYPYFKLKNLLFFV